MKKILLLLLFFIYTSLLCQSLKVDYIFTVNLYKSIEFPANLYVDNNTGEKLYTVKFALSDDTIDSTNGSVSFNSKVKSEYILYAPSSKQYLINDNINEKNFVLEDNVNLFIWKITNENKKINNVELTKAVSEFRGRIFTIWFDIKSKVKAGPWKFNNLPGLVYEAYDSTENYKWTLKKIGKSNTKIENPFQDYKGEFISYKKYPKLRYGLSSELEAELKKNPYNTIKEQERNGIEIKFEWEN